MPEYSPEELELLTHIDPRMGLYPHEWFNDPSYDVATVQVNALKALSPTRWDLPINAGSIILLGNRIGNYEDFLYFGGSRFTTYGHGGIPFGGLFPAFWSRGGPRHWMLDERWSGSGVHVPVFDFYFYWQVAAVLTFSLRRPIKGVTEPKDPMGPEIPWGMMIDNLELVGLWWKSSWSHTGFGRSKEDSPWWYSYYDDDDEEKVYSHVWYLDPTDMMGVPGWNAGIILRLNGTKTSQQVSAGAAEDITIEITPPRHIPIFPHWDDKIVEKFHRSTDPEMQEYTKALDDWSALMNNAISQLA